MSKKGSEWERIVSKSLSLWWSEGEDDSVFWRSSQSGGRATQRAKKEKKTANSYGDIAAMDPTGFPFTQYFCVELKRGYTKEIDVLDCVDGKKKNPTLYAFWKQCENDRTRGGIKQSLVIIKRDRKEPIIIFRASIFRELFSREAINSKLKYVKMMHNDDYAIPSLMLMLFKDWLKWVEPETIRSLCSHRG